MATYLVSRGKEEEEEEEGEGEGEEEGEEEGEWKRRSSVFPFIEDIAPSFSSLFGHYLTCPCPAKLGTAAGVYLNRGELNDD